MNRKSPADQGARARIRTELNRSMLVEAGAGSGKTHEMATRMAAGIASGVYEIEHMAPGFTELDEAEEMRVRRQSWRDYRAQAKAAGDPNVLALDDAGIQAKHLE